MSFLKSLFGPSQKQIWRQLSRQVDGRFHEGGFFATSAVQARHRDWIITLDTYTQSTGNSHQTFTRLRAPYFNPEGFRFEVYRSSIFSGLGKSLGMQDIQVGHRRFDQDFVIKGTDPERVRWLFDSQKIRRLIDAQPRIRLSVKAHERWLSKFPAGVDELHFQSAGVIKDLEQLKALFDLFAEVLQQVCHDGRAYEDDVRIHMRRLRAPGGRIEDKHILWESYGQRRDAAAALGRLGDPVAIPALASVLRDEDEVLAVRSIEALTAIGGDRAIGPLVARLGDGQWTDGRPMRERVAEALAQLGAQDLADTVLAALGGDFGRLKAQGGAYREPIIESLATALDGPSGAHAADALAGIHAVEALPRLRKILRNIGAGGPTGEAVASAVRALEARASLPRAASGADVQADTLPRAARQPDDNRATLPRGARAPDNR